MRDANSLTLIHSQSQVLPPRSAETQIIELKKNDKEQTTPYLRTEIKWIKALKYVPDCNY
jgi:hypothetical protein